MGRLETIGSDGMIQLNELEITLTCFFVFLGLMHADLYIQGHTYILYQYEYNNNRCTPQSVEKAVKNWPKKQQMNS